MTATRQDTAKHPEKRKKREEVHSDDSAATEVMTNYVDRYEHANFFTLRAPIENDDSDSSGLEVEDLLRIVSQSDEETIIAVKAKKRVEQPKRSMLPSAEEKLDALTGKIDQCYHATVLIGETPVMVTEAMRKNSRPYMEDRCDVAKLAGLQYLNDDDLNNIANKTTRKLNTLCVDADIDNAGSTYLNVVIELSSQRIITTQLGDCEAWLHWIDESGAHYLEALHGVLHHPHDPGEFKRLQDAGQKTKCSTPDHPHLLRLANGIAVSRALGDKASVPFGLIRQPTVTIKSYKKISAQAKQIRIIVGSDGVFGVKQFASHGAFGAFLSAPENQLSQILLTNKMIDATMSREDNASIMTAEIPLHAKAPAAAYACESAISLTVCDGHGTYRVAEKVTQMHADIQQSIINKYLAACRPDVRQLPLCTTTPLDVTQDPPSIPKTVKRTATMFGGQGVVSSAEVADMVTMHRFGE